MTDQEQQSLRETKRKEKRIEEETEGLAKEQVRKKAYLVREEAIEKALKAKKTLLRILSN
jgi:predicted DNA-binding protein